MRQFTNRVYLPDGRKLYVSNDRAGDVRMEEIFDQYGNLKIEVCDRVLGTSLDDQTVVFQTDIERYFS